MISIQTSTQSFLAHEFESLIETYRSSLSKTTKISICLKNPIHHLAALYACLLSSKRVFSENAFQSDKERIFARELFKPDQVIDIELSSQKNKLQQKQLDPNSLLAIATSGSSGKSKVVLIKPKALIASAQASCDFYQIKSEDLILSPLPLNHIGGLLPLWRALESNSRLRIAENGDWKTALDDKAQFISLVPTQLQQLLQSNFNMKDFKAVIIGGQALDKKIFLTAKEKSMPISLSYGSSESVAILSATKPSETFNGSVGNVLKNRDISIIDKHLCFKGEACFYGYQEEDKDVLPFDDNGFFHTQDLARLENNELYIDGRADFIYKSGGENINPKELEDYFLDRSSLKEIHVLPLIDPNYQNLNSALVSPKNNTTINEILSLNQTLPSFQKIRFISSSLPITSGLKLKATQIKEAVNNNFLKWNLFQLNSPTKDKPDLVFFHGFMGNSESLKDLAHQFSNQFNIWTLDLPFHGNHLNHHYNNWDDIIDEIACLLIRFSNLWIYGYSMGGRLALGLLDRYPKLVKKLILEGTHPGLKTVEERKQRIEFENDIIKKMINFDTFLKEWYQAKLFQLNDSQILTLIAMTKNIPKSYEQAFKTYGLSSQPDYSSLVNNQSIIALSGELDHKYQMLWPNSLIIKGCSHKASFQDPIQVSKLVLDHLAH